MLIRKSQWLVWDIPCKFLLIFLVDKYFHEYWKLSWKKIYYSPIIVSFRNLFLPSLYKQRGTKKPFFLRVKKIKLLQVGLNAK